MKIKMALTLVALAGSLLAVTTASAVPVGAAGESIKTGMVGERLVDQVHYRHWRRHHNHQRYYAYRYRPYYYSSYNRPYYRPYYAPYYSSYYSPYYYGYSRGYYRGGGVSVRLRF